LGNDVGQDIADAISGKESVDAAIKQAQTEANQVAKQGGYQK